MFSTFYNLVYFSVYLPYLQEQYGQGQAEKTTPKPGDPDFMRPIEGPGQSAQSAQTPMFGEDWEAYFKEVYEAENVDWISPRGIQYGFDDGLNELDWLTVVTKKGETRLDHINRHAVPRPDRETHGVFNGNPKDMVDQAWANRGGIVPVDDYMGGKVYNIPWENAGYESGYLNTGEQMDYITIIVEDGSSELFVAFPSYEEYITKGMK